MKRRISLKLYVSGSRSAAERTSRELSEFWEGAAHESVEVAVIDVCEFPEVAEVNRILATPSLVRESPRPPRVVVGEISNLGKAAFFLGLQARLGRSNKKAEGGNE